MQVDTRGGFSQNGVMDLPIDAAERLAHVGDYLEKSTKQLAEMTDLVGRGEAIDPEARGWILAEVDFLVETIGDENLGFDEDMRSNLLQLLLALANLNEQIRHQASLKL
jgi:hypothetical protein